MWPWACIIQVAYLHSPGSRETNLTLFSLSRMVEGPSEPSEAGLAFPSLPPLPWAVPVRLCIQAPTALGVQLQSSIIALCHGELLPTCQVMRLQVPSDPCLVHRHTPGPSTAGHRTDPWLGRNGGTKHASYLGNSSHLGFALGSTRTQRGMRQPGRNVIHGMHKPPRSF